MDQSYRFRLFEKNTNIQLEEVSFDYEGNMSAEEVKKATLLHFCLLTLNKKNLLNFCSEIIKKPQEGIDKFLAHTEKLVDIKEISETEK